MIAWNEGRLVGAAGRSAVPTAASPSWTSRCDEPLLFAAEPDLSDERRCWRCCRSASPSTSSTSRVTQRGRDARCSARSSPPAPSSISCATTRTADLHDDGAAHRATCPSSRRPSTTNDPADRPGRSPTSYQSQLSSNLLLVTERTGRGCWRPFGASPPRRDRRAPTAGGPRRARRP